jgi:hypothetical protein
MFVRSGSLRAAPVTPPAAQEFHEEYCEYVFDKELTASQALTDLSVFIDGDSDFLWQALKGTQDGTYKVRFRMPNGRYMSSALVNNASCVGSGAFPVPIGASGILLGAGTKLGIDITDTSAAGGGNTVQIVLVGIRRYRTA